MICFEGNLSVKATLLANRRNVREIWIDKKKDDRDIQFIIMQAKKRNVPVKRVDRVEIDEIATGKTHGGVVCFGGERGLQTVEDCLNTQMPFLAILEGIEDPFNLGYALRTLYAAGCSGVLLNKRDWSHVENTIVKSSAGASEYMNLCFVDDMGEAIQKSKQAGCICYSAMRKEAIEYFDADFNQPLLLSIGGEMRGLSKIILEKTDQNIYVPYSNDFKNALNASSAVAAISFEIVRQRR